MKRTILLTALGGMTLGLLATSPVFADDGGGECDGERTHARGDRDFRDGRRGPPPPLSELLPDAADEIGLDDATLDAVLALLEAEEPGVRALHEEARAARDAGDREAGHEARQAARDAQEALMAEVEALLSEEQAEALREVLPPPPRRGHGERRGGEGRGGEGSGGERGQR